MGLLGPVVRVGCLRRRASVVLEEWSPSPVRGGQNPAYRPSGIISDQAELAEAGPIGASEDQVIQHADIQLPRDIDDAARFHLVRQTGLEIAARMIVGDHQRPAFQGQRVPKQPAQRDIDVSALADRVDFVADETQRPAEVENMELFVIEPQQDRTEQRHGGFRSCYFAIVDRAAEQP